MNIFKKIFKRKKKQETQENECWYNNTHEKIESRGFSTEAADMGGCFPAEISSAKSISQQQT